MNDVEKREQPPLECSPSKVWCGCGLKKIKIQYLAIEHVDSLRFPDLIQVLVQLSLKTGNPKLISF